MNGTVSGIITSLLLLTFIGGWIWAWSPKRRADFDAAARMPLDDSDAVKPTSENKA